MILGLWLLPILFHHLSKEKLGIWLLLGQSWAALGIFDFGFGVTLTRRIAFARGRSGSDPDAVLTQGTLREIADLVMTGKLVYRALAIFAFIFSFAVGALYIRSLHPATVPLAQIWVAWGILCLSQAIGVWAGVWDSVLTGIGYVGWESVLGSFVAVLTSICQIVAVLLGGGLISLALVAATGALMNRFLLLGFAKRRRPEIFSIKGLVNFDLVKNMVPLALRAWITSLGGAVVLCSDQFLIASMWGVAAVPAYRAAFIIVHNLNTIAMTLPLASQVFISHLWQTNELGRIHKIIQNNICVCWLVMLSGTAYLMIAGESFFGLWLGAGNFIGYAILGLLLISETLEAQSYTVATLSRATEDEAFSISVFTGALLKLLLAWTFGRYLGILGIALGTVVGLFLGNQWYMLYRGLNRLCFSITAYAKITALLCGLWFPVNLLILSIAWRALVEASARFQILGATVIEGILVVIGCWCLILNSKDRLTLQNILSERVGDLSKWTFRK